MRTRASELISDFFGLFFPHVCLACSAKLYESEEILCFKCEQELPRTEHWKNADNPLMKRFWGRVELQAAASFMVFQKGESVQHLLHQLKYRRRQDVGKYLGKKFGLLLKSEESVVKNIDLIIPVPLHAKKLKQRGYNQCDSFAEGLSEVLEVPWTGEALERVKENISQTKITRFDRYDNVSRIFAVSDETLLQGKHILLVDDVVTTGATAEACLNTIVFLQNTKVSFASIAVALR